jgi:protein TonB
VNAPLAPADMGFHTLYPASRRFEWDACIAIALSLAFHAVVLIALLRPAWPMRAAAASATVLVSVDLTASQPALAAMPALPEPPRRRHREFIERQGIEGLPRLQASDIPSGKDAGGDTPARALRRGPSHSASLAAIESPHTPTPQHRPAHLAQDADNRTRDAQSAYRRLLAEYLARVKRYPAPAVVQHDQGTVWLSFRLDRSGRLLSWRISASSDYPLLDDEVARMVVAAAPYPPFPSSWDAQTASFDVPIDFSLN